MMGGPVCHPFLPFLRQNLNWAATELQAPSPLRGFQSPSPASSGDWKMMAPGIGKMMKN